MNYISKLLLFFSLFCISLTLHATQAPWEIQATMTSDTSIEIDWEDVDNVLWYYIYYGESSWIWGDYDIEWVDLIESSEFTLEDLKAETRYYIAVTAVDDTWSESSPSPELEATTLNAWSEAQAVSLRIVEASVVDDTSIEMTFSLDMESWSNAQRQFIIENIESGEEIWVDISDVVPGKPQNILAILDRKLQSSSQYKITVIDVRDINGNTIESWIDAFVNFTTPAVFTNVLESAWPQQDTTSNETSNETDMIENTSTNVDISENLELETVINTQNTPQGNNAGTTISTEEIAENTLNTAADNDKLPQTGPEHWILFLIAVMISTWLFYRFKAS